MPKDNKPILKPFNPLDKRNLGESVAEALLQTEARPLPPEQSNIYYRLAYHIKILKL